MLGLSLSMTSLGLGGCSRTRYAPCHALAARLLCAFVTQTWVGAVPLTFTSAALLFADVSYEYLGQDAFCRVNETSAERIQFEVGSPSLVVLRIFTNCRTASAPGMPGSLCLSRSGGGLL